MSVNTNLFENYKNTVGVSEKGGFLSKVKGFGVDSLGGLDSFMGKDIVNANKLLKSFKGFDLSSMFSSLGGFFENLGDSALKLLKDMGTDALRSLENASINFVSNLAEDLYNNVLSMSYIPDTAFAATLKSLYLAGADLAYNKHYIRKTALQRDWVVSLEFIDEQYGIDYNIRDYKGLEEDLSFCATNSCVNNLFYIFTKMYKQIRSLQMDLNSQAIKLEEYSEPIYDYKIISYTDALVSKEQLYIDSDVEKLPIPMNLTSNSQIEFVVNRPDFDYYVLIVIGFRGIENGLYKDYQYISYESKENIRSKYSSYILQRAIIENTKHLMITYLKSLIIHGYTYLTAASLQKFFSEFNTVLSPKYYGITDDKYNKSYNFTQEDCLIMMPSYIGNDFTKSDKYTQELQRNKNNAYLVLEGAKSEAAKAATDAKNAKFNTNQSGFNTTIDIKSKTATAKIKEFRANAQEKVAGKQNAHYASTIKGGIVGVTQNQSNGLWNRSGTNINASKDGRKLSSMYDRDVVKNYELVGTISDNLDSIDFLNKDTKYIVLRNKNIKQIYALLSNDVIYGNNKMVNDYFYKRCKITTMNTLNQSLSKAAGILGTSYAVQSLFDLESAIDASAYNYIKKVEKFLLNPKEHSYYGLTDMFTGDFWNQFGDYFKQAYTMDDGVSDPALESLINKLSSGNLESSKASVSDIDPKDLNSSNGSNPKTFNEILTELDKNPSISTYVDNIMRFMSSIPALELRDILNNYLAAFYKYMKARDYEPTEYFETLIKSMSGISNIKDYTNLNNDIFSKSTHASLLANGKFLVSIYALNNSYKYFLSNNKDTNKEELTKIYNLVFALASAEIQTTGLISSIYKYDKEQLNSLVKQNFFTSINYLKSINDKNNPLIKTAPGYKDAMTKSFNNTFDLRGLTGYSFDNNKLLYVTEHGLGDWNSIGVSNDREIGTFFCKSNINGSGSGIYRRISNNQTLSKVDIRYSNNSVVADRDFYVAVTLLDKYVYFGIDDFNSNKSTPTNTLFIFNTKTNKIEGVSGFTDNPKDYNFILDSGKNLLFLSSKHNKGLYYTSLGTTSSTNCINNGGNHNLLTLDDNSLIIYPGNETASNILYFDKSGKFINSCELPNTVRSISTIQKTIINTNYTISKTTTTTNSEGETVSETTNHTYPVKIYGILVGTNIGIVNCLLKESYSDMGVPLENKSLELGQTYKFSNDDRSCYIYDNLVIGTTSDYKIIYRKLIPESPQEFGTEYSIISKDLFKFEANIEADNFTYRNLPDDPLQQESVIKSIKHTLDGLYVLLTRSEMTTSELYFIPCRSSDLNPKMYMLRDNINPNNTISNLFTTQIDGDMISTISNIIQHSDNSLDYISISKTIHNVIPKLIDSKFIDISDDVPSEDSIIVKRSKSGWKNIYTLDNKLYIQNSKYGVLLFDNGTISDIVKYSRFINDDITIDDIVFDFKILTAKGVTFLANSSSGNKLINKCYGIFKSTNAGITYNYIDPIAFHDGDISDIGYDAFNNCMYFSTYRDKTVFNYDYMATIAAFDIDSFISNLNYYQLSKLAKAMLLSQTSVISNQIISLLEEKNENGIGFKYTIDELLNGITDATLRLLDSNQKVLLNSSLFTELSNYKTAKELFEDVDDPNFNDDMTAEFVFNYPGDISTAPNTNSEDFSIQLTLEEIGDLNDDGVLDDLDRNWYLALLNGREIDSKTTLDKWFDNLANGLYGNGLGNLISLRLNFNEQIRLLSNFRAKKAKFLTSGKALSKDEFTDFMNTDEDGKSEWS